MRICDIPDCFIQPNAQYIRVRSLTDPNMLGTLSGACMNGSWRFINWNDPYHTRHAFLHNDCKCEIVEFIDFAIFHWGKLPGR